MQIGHALLMIGDPRVVLLYLLDQIWSFEVPENRL
jgi:hypothetical protein